MSRWMLKVEPQDSLICCVWKVKPTWCQKRLSRFSDSMISVFLLFSESLFLRGKERRAKKEEAMKRHGLDEKRQCDGTMRQRMQTASGVQKMKKKDSQSPQKEPTRSICILPLTFQESFCNKEDIFLCFMLLDCSDLLHQHRKLRHE